MFGSSNYCGSEFVSLACIRFDMADVPDAVVFLYKHKAPEVIRRNVVHQPKVIQPPAEVPVHVPKVVAPPPHVQTEFKVVPAKYPAKMVPAKFPIAKANAQVVLPKATPIMKAQAKAKPQAWGPKPPSFPPPRFPKQPSQPPPRHLVKEEQVEQPTQPMVPTVTVKEELPDEVPEVDVLPEDVEWQETCFAPTSASSSTDDCDALLAIAKSLREDTTRIPGAGSLVEDFDALLADAQTLREAMASEEEHEFAAEETVEHIDIKIEPTDEPASKRCKTEPVEYDEGEGF